MVDQHISLPSSVPWVLAVAGVLLAAALWVYLHRLKPAGALRLWPLRLAKLAVGFGTILLGLLTIQLALLLTTSWPLWVVALLGAAAVEILVGVYRLERRTVKRSLGLTLTALRIAAALGVVLMLAQPVRSLDLTDRIVQQVAIVLDKSASMLIHDTALAPHEKIRLAERLGVQSAKRKHRMEDSAAALAAMRDETNSTLESLAALEQLKGDDRQQRLADRRGDLGKFAKENLQALDKLIKEVDAPLVEQQAPLSVPTRGALGDVKARLSMKVRPAFEQVATFTADKNADRLGAAYVPLMTALRAAAGDLADLAPKTEQASQAMDASLYAALPAPKKAEVDGIAAWPRYKLACELLLRSAGDDKAVIEQLLAKYKVRLYTFDSSTSEVDVAQWKSSAAGIATSSAPTPRMNIPQPASTPATASAPASLPADDTGAAQGTDLATALRKVMVDLGADQLAGVVILSDGRHNAKAPVETVVRQLGMQRVPVCSVVMGSSRPPTDAAIVSIDAPDTIFVKDRTLINVDLKLDGLNGQSVQVRLNDGDKIVDTRDVHVSGDSVRTRVALADTPQRVGPHAYRISVQSFEGEVFADNNAYDVTLNVTDDRTRLLLIEDRPRWEFRYLKNLFASRDNTIRLQYLLFEPDKIQDMPAKPQDRLLAASVTNGADQVECDLLPATEADWLKFDVIVLGDVAPERFTKVQLESLRKFVTDHGGTLVVIPGPNYMPHAYLGTPLADLLPVTIRPLGETLSVAAPEPTYRWALTGEGAEHVIMRQEMDNQANRTFWSKRPEMYWRYPLKGTKSGATVLAYAMPPDAPAYMKDDPSLAPAAAASTTASQLASQEQTLRLRKEFEASHALVVTQNVAMGQVLFMGTDRTWRLRYRAGDTYHHRFWGQVMRWATGNKLPAGTALVKLGTDKARYAPSDKITAKAKISRQDMSPLVSTSVAVNVFHGKTQVLHRTMNLTAETPGLYTADLGELPSGSYRLELDAPDAKPLLAADKVEKVATEFSVDPSAPLEQVELAADRGLLSHLASVSGGKALDPWRIQEILPCLGPGVKELHQSQQYTLWDAWGLLALIMVLITAEWLLRKKVGLA